MTGGKESAEADRKELSMKKMVIFTMSVMLAGVLIPETIMAADDREVVNFWYLWGGTEEQVILDAIDVYNASQDKYKVVGTMTDTQAQTAGMASTSGPDITDIIDVNVASLASTKAITNLEEYVAADQYDLSDFNQAAVSLCRYEGELYGMPLNSMINMVYYNKADFEAAGITEFPTTLDEMYELACKLTITDESGAIQQLGWPWLEDALVDPIELADAFGVEWVSEDEKTATCNSDTMLEAYEYLMKYVDKYGYDNLAAFVSQYSGTDATSQDPLFTGAMAMRADGSYLYKALLNYEYDPDTLGVFEMPIMSEGGHRVSSSIFIIPSLANNKEGAWDFMKWIHSEEGMTYICKGFGNEPSRLSLADSEEFLEESPLYEDFVTAGIARSVPLFPSVPCASEYIAEVNAVTYDIVTGNVTAEDAMNALAEKMDAKLQ